MSAPSEFEQGVERAWQLEKSGRLGEAERAWEAVLARWPDDPDAASHAAQLSMRRGDVEHAIGLLQHAAQTNPAHTRAATDLGILLMTHGREAEAVEVFAGIAARGGDAWVAGLLLGRLREDAGDERGALRAWYPAVRRAQRAGHWCDERSTPPQLLQLVLHAIERIDRGRRAFYFGAFEALRQEHGADALRRVDRALAGFLGDWDATPPDLRQRPRFFFFPDLPNAPYGDPFLHPWAQRLQEAFPHIRAEAVRVLAEDRRFQNFLKLSDRARGEDYVAGAWEALFFYRRGKRHDETHVRCPQTSAVLESSELCRIADQAPEICFSVLEPGTHLKAHYGVTNVRHVMHLPLVVPADCALNLVGVGEHAWQEGRLVTFDDTFQHEAWNRSAQPRMILLMDCWNPHLTAVERLALARLIETITDIQAPTGLQG
jgi:aspartate beta-hydroxylase